MTETILKSEALKVHTFEAAVARHAQFHREWLDHMKRVEDDERNGITGIAKHQPYPAPHAHPAVMRSVDQNGNADYTIKDDGPTPAQALDAAKRDLSMQVDMLEASVVEAIAPVRKLRISNIRERDIISTDDKNRSGISKSIVSKAKAMIFGGPTLDEQVAAMRSSDDTAFLQTQVDLRTKIDVVRRRAAQAHGDIDGLTAATLPAWKMPDLTA